MNQRNEYPQFYVGTELSTNHVSVGEMNQGYFGTEFKKNNTQLTRLLTNNTKSANTWYTCKLRKEGNDYSVIIDNETLTYTTDQMNPQYLFLIYLPNGKSKNLKIKPL